MQKTNYKNLLKGFFVLGVIAVLSLSLKNIIWQRPLTKIDESSNTSQLVIHGNNSFGQLGEASYILGTGFNNVSLPDEVLQLAVGRNYTMVLTKGGKVLSWGGNEWGQLGYEQEEGLYYSTERKEIYGIANPVKLASSNNHSLVLQENGQVAAFGSNFSGQLGTGDNNDTATPKIVENLEDVKDIAAGYKFSVALKKDGSVWGWGASCEDSVKKEAQEWWQTALSSFNSIDGGYYDPTSDALAAYSKQEYCINEEVVGILSKTPVEIENLTNIKSVSAGYGHVLALSEDGKIWSFGCNTYKQLGRKINNKTENPKPGVVSNLTDVKQISAGYRHSIALKKDGTLWGWGINNHGQLATKTSEEIQPEPIQIPISDVSYVVAAYDYTIALKNDGSVWGWGINRQHLFAPEEVEFVTTPVKLEGFENIKSVAASGGHVVAVAN